MATPEQSLTVNATAVRIDGVQVSVGIDPANPGEKLLLIGPVVLVAPLTSDAAKAIASALMGIHIAQPGDVVL